MNRGSLFWGSVLVLLGGLMLAGQMGVRLPNGNSVTSLFWPLLLVGLGVWTLIGVFGGRAAAEVETASVSLQNAKEARLRINHGAGELRLHSGADGADLARGTFTGGLKHQATMDGDRLEVRMEPAENVMFPPFGSRAQLDWDVALNPSIPIELDMHLGANKADINLRDLKVTAVHLASGASDAVITVPEKGRLTLDCEVGAASLTLVIPDGVAIRTHAAIGVGEFKVDRSRFPANTSPDFETSPNAVDIRVKGGAATVKVK